MFIPLFPVDRIFLDEQVGEVECYRQRCKQRVGEAIEVFLGLATGEREIPS